MDKIGSAMTMMSSAAAMAGIGSGAVSAGTVTVTAGTVTVTVLMGVTAIVHIIMKMMPFFRAPFHRANRTTCVNLCRLPVMPVMSGNRHDKYR